MLHHKHCLRAVPPSLLCPGGPILPCVTFMWRGSVHVFAAKSHFEHSNRDIWTLSTQHPNLRQHFHSV